MAAGPSGVVTVANGTRIISDKPIELSIGLSHSPGTRIYVHLTVLATSIILFLTSAGIEAGQSGAAMGSFIYAMPDVKYYPPSLGENCIADTLPQRYNPSQPISTPLYSSPSSMDFTTRLSKLLVRRTNKLCYVGGGINLSEAAGGGSVEEEMEAFRAIVDVVVAEVAKTANSSDHD